MNENEKNFESLRKLLALKRHETPPPGYFNSFSGQVIARIRAGNAKSSRSAEAPWFVRFFQLFELKPAFAGAFASALCLLLFFAIFYADRPDSMTAPFMPVAESTSGSFAAVNPAIMPQAASTPEILTSTNPATSLQPVASLFDSQNPFVQTVSFSPSGD
jgi:hypothetical protein